MRGTAASIGETSEVRFGHVPTKERAGGIWVMDTQLDFAHFHVA